LATFLRFFETGMAVKANTQKPILSNAVDPTPGSLPADRKQQMTDTTSETEIAVQPAPPAEGRLLRLAHNVGWTLIYLGVLTLGFVVHQLYITSWFASQNQPELAAERIEQWAATEITEVVVVPATPPDDGNGGVVSGATGDGGDGIRTEPLVLQVESPPELGAAFALIRIPKIDRLRDGWNVVEGVRTVDLRNGAGHMPDTALPGQPGNAVISGHRTTWGQPFHELDALDPGDRIEVDTALGTHIYAVREIRVVEPTDVWVADPREGAWLTLTTCHPKFSARERLVIAAELVFGPNADVIEVMS
jgi:sortase A